MQTEFNPIMVALDVPDAGKALSLAQELRPHVGGLKVGLELFVSAGPAIVVNVGREGRLPPTEDQVGGAGLESISRACES